MYINCFSKLRYACAGVFYNYATYEKLLARVNTIRIVSGVDSNVLNVKNDL